MKAVFVMDEMPDSCSSCPLEHDGFCRGTEKETEDTWIYERATWCPLKVAKEKTYNVR